MLRATSIGSYTLLLNKNRSKYFFPKNTVITDIASLGILIAVELQTINDVGTGRKVINLDIAKQATMTLVDSNKQVVVRDVPITYFDVTMCRSNALNYCIDWSSSYVSFSNVVNVADLNDYEVIFYFFKGSQIDLFSTIHNTKTVTIEPGFNGSMGKLLSENDCINVKKIDIKTYKNNDFWLNIRDSKNRYFQQLHKNLFLREEGANLLEKFVIDWQFDNIVFDLEETKIQNGNATTYLTFYF